VNAALTLQFDQPDILTDLETMGGPELDHLDFGVIGFDAEGVVRRYNRRESELAGLSRERVLGTHLFTTVAPCMNNYMVAQRFEDAASSGTSLNAALDYVFTLRMRPTQVKLRLLASPRASLRYVLVNRPS
jgi:photoactive yellow protein